MMDVDQYDRSELVIELLKSINAGFTSLSAEERVALAIDEYEQLEKARIIKSISR